MLKHLLNFYFSVQGLFGVHKCCSFLSICPTSCHLLGCNTSLLHEKDQRKKFGKLYGVEVFLINKCKRNLWITQTDQMTGPIRMHFYMIQSHHDSMRLSIYMPRFDKFWFHDMYSLVYLSITFRKLQYF